MKRFLSILLFGVLVFMTTVSHAVTDPIKPGKELKTPVFKPETDVTTLKMDWTTTSKHYDIAHLKVQAEKKTFLRQETISYCSSNEWLTGLWLSVVLQSSNWITYSTRMWHGCAECLPDYCAYVTRWVSDVTPGN